MLTSSVRVVVASEAERRPSDPHWCALRRPHALATQESLECIILSRIFEKVGSRTMTLKEEGEAY